LTREMSPKKRVVSAILGGRVDRIPATCVCQTATYDQMRAVNTYWPEAHSDAEKMVKLAKAAYELTGLEAARVPFDQAVEAEALGGTMEIKGDMPTITRHAFKSFSSLRIPENFLELKRMPVVLDAVERMKEEVGDYLPVIAGMVGPFTVSTLVFGPTFTLKSAITSPKELAKAILTFVDPLTDYAKELFSRGADIVVIEDMYTSQIGPRLFREHAKEPLKRLISSLNGIVVLHICGNVVPIITDMMETGADGVSVETTARLDEIMAATKGRLAVIGNIGPIDPLMQGTPDGVEEAVRSAIEGGVDVVSPGCSIAPRSPLENVKRMVEATRRYGVRGERATFAPRKIDFAQVFTHYGFKRRVKPMAAEVSVKEPELAAVSKAVIDGNSEEVRRLVEEALGKFDPLTIIADGLTDGMNRVSEMWEEDELFLPQVMKSADAMQIGVETCEKSMAKAPQRKGVVVAHVVEGDIHDIGKNIVVALLRANGYEVVDLGRDVPLERVVTEVKKRRPMLVIGTALMTTTMTALPRLVTRLREEGIFNVPLACGGGAVTQDYVETFENSIRGEKAIDVVRIAEMARQGKNWLEIRREVHK
jgi:MtaA/CmuA family methyltransferase